MIKPLQKGSAQHWSKCVKSIGTFEEGKDYGLQLMRMHGKLFKPGKDEKGKWMDTVGVEDKRLMAFSGSSYVVTEIEQINECFNEY